MKYFKNNSKVKNNLKQIQLSILRSSVEKAENNIGFKKVNDVSVKKIIKIIEDFLKKKKLIIYGGTALNNILPKKDQFYDKKNTFPDYDFFSTDALQDAIELADLYYNNGFKEVEAKSAAHYGTYKIFVNFMSVGDITNMNKKLYNNIKNKTIVIDKLHYAPPNFLRMSIYNELSRPEGDVSRWEKIFKRLLLLDKYYPINKENINCNFLLFNQNKDFFKEKYVKNIYDNYKEDNIGKEDDDIYDITLKLLYKEDIVFLGGFSDMFYLKFLKGIKINRDKIIKDNNNYIIDILSKNPENIIKKIKEIKEIAEHKNNNSEINIKVIKKNTQDDILPSHYYVTISNKSNNVNINIYDANDKCNSYNTVYIENNAIKIASIETKIYYYLAFMYLNDKHYDIKRIFCLANFLFLVQEQNILNKRKLLKKFPVNCYGKDKLKEDIRETKTKKYEELKNKKNSLEYHKWFFRYMPHINSSKNKIIGEKFYTSSSITEKEEIENEKPKYIKNKTKKTKKTKKNKKTTTIKIKQKSEKKDKNKKEETNEDAMLYGIKKEETEKAKLPKNIIKKNKTKKEKEEIEENEEYKTNNDKTKKNKTKKNKTKKNKTKKNKTKKNKKNKIKTIFNSFSIF